MHGGNASPVPYKSPRRGPTNVALCLRGPQRRCRMQKLGRMATASQHPITKEYYYCRRTKSISLHPCKLSSTRLYLFSPSFSPDNRAHHPCHPPWPSPSRPVSSTTTARCAPLHPGRPSKLLIPPLQRRWPTCRLLRTRMLMLQLRLLSVRSGFGRKRRILLARGSCRRRLLCCASAMMRLLVLRR